MIARGLMLVLLVVWGSPAQATPRNVDLCVVFDTEFSDTHIGDFWIDNADHRFARGVEIRIIDDTSTRDLRLSETTGCINVTVEATAPNYYFELRARNNAIVNGVTIESFNTQYYDQRPVISYVWPSVSALNTTPTKIIPAHQHWENLAIATWVFNRSDFRIHSGTTRACCLEADPSYQEDGTCSSAPQAGNEYTVLNRPVRMFAHAGLRCGQSTVATQAGVDEVAVGTDSVCTKPATAHELGHVVAEMRMGGKESGQYPETAPLNGCAGDCTLSGAVCLPTDSDTVGSQARGTFTKEYKSTAYREGWGNFFSIWAWNSRQHSDCVFRHLEGNFGDFNLDGIADNDFVGAVPPLDADFDCIGTPYLSSDPVPAPMDGANWLEDLETWDDDNLDGIQCLRDAISANELNRSSVYDVGKFFWFLTAVDPIGLIEPEELADLYIDMCPRGWAEADTCNEQDVPADGCDDEFPFYRQIESAEANGDANFITQVLAAANTYINH